MKTEQAFDQYHQAVFSVAACGSGGGHHLGVFPLRNTRSPALRPGARRGRYILSLVPHDGFQKSGTIRDNVLSFQLDGQQYEIRTPDLILGVKGAWNLYAMHGPQYQPKVDWISMGTDRLDNLLPNR